jgi:hypothetical protein
MRNIGAYNLANCSPLLAAGPLLALLLSSGNPSQVSAQGSKAWTIAQAQQAVRQQIANQEGGRAQIVRFNSDAQTEARSNAAVRVSGTGVFSANNGSRNDTSRWREFSYEAIVLNRSRNRGNNSSVSGVRYDWRGGWSSSNDNNNSRGNYRSQNIYCASDDGRRRTCPINTGSGNVRLVNQRSGTACVQGRTWGFNRTGIWVDRGCRADFEVGGLRGSGSNNAGVSGFGGDKQPDGRVTYTGPIMNRHSNKELDVTGQSTQEGAHVQQWSFADQPNQNWNVIDLGNGEAAIIVTEQSKQNGANIQLWDYANQANQQWRLKR